MNVQPKNEASVSSETERLIRHFVRAAVTQLPVLSGEIIQLEDHAQWERFSDGHFHIRKKGTSTPWPLQSDKWLQSLTDYRPCIDRMMSDVVIGPHLNRLVGTSMSALLLVADNILLSLIHSMRNEQGSVEFTDERFDCEFKEWVRFFSASEVATRMVAPLRYLIAPFPIRLNTEILLDRLTDEEVTRCAHVAVLRPVSEQFPVIRGEAAAGVRRTQLWPKVIRSEAETRQMIDMEDEGAFGSRPAFRDDLVVEDVLSALRLLKHTQIRAAGLAIWKDARWLDNEISYQLLSDWPYGQRFELLDGEVEQFLHLWQLLEACAGRFEFAIHRFNLAFDRLRWDDRIIDLVIAAESLFLNDISAKDRGELRFRFALRAAKFIEHPSYSQYDVFGVMRRAYDVRSTIVHGGRPKETSLPDNPSATAPEFVDRIEELMRLALRKALSLREEGSRLRQSEYWDSLVLESQHRGV